MQDLFQALKMLQSGVQQFAVGRVINSANDKVQELRQSDMDERSRIQGLRQTANDLTLRLAGMGADDSTIKAAAGAIEPPKGPLVQSPFQGMLADLDTAVPADQEEAVRRSKEYWEKGAEYKALADARKNGRADTAANKKLREGLITGFGKIPGNKELIEGFTKLEVTPDDLTNPGAFVAAQRGYIKSTGDSRISNEDLAGANVDPSLWEGVKTLFSRGTLGTETKNKAALMQALMDTQRYKSARALKARLAPYSRSSSRQVDGDTPEVFAQDLMDRFLGGAANFEPAAAAPRSTTQGTTVIQNPGASTPAAIGTAPAALPAGFRPRGK